MEGGNLREGEALVVAKAVSPSRALPLLATLLFCVVVGVNVLTGCRIRGCRGGEAVPISQIVLPFSDLFLLVIVGSLVSIASFLPMSLLYTGAAPVTKFLFIAGRTDTPLTGIPVISRRAGKRKSILRSFCTHKDHAPFFYIIDLSKKRFNTNNQKIQRNT